MDSPLPRSLTLASHPSDLWPFDHMLGQPVVWVSRLCSGPSHPLGPLAGPGMRILSEWDTEWRASVFSERGEQSRNTSGILTAAQKDGIHGARCPLSWVFR